MFRLQRRVYPEVEEIVRWMPEILFPAEIVFPWSGPMHARVKIESARAHRQRSWQIFAQFLRRSCSAMPSEPALLRHAYQTTFCEIRRSHSSGLFSCFPHGDGLQMTA